MKRHETLAPLSREHHGALLLARLLRNDAPVYKGMPEQPGDKAIYALNYFTTNLQSHFTKEETLLHEIKKYHNSIATLAAEIITEHQQLSQMFNSLKDAKNLPVTLDKLGRLLEDHIRKEERILFPLVQEHCPGSILNTISL